MLTFRLRLRLRLIRTEIAFRVAPWLAEAPTVVFQPVPFPVVEMCECDLRIAHAVNASAE